MTLTVRTPTLVDAVGAGMAHHQILRETLAGKDLPAEFWEKNSEESLVSYWHQCIATATGGRIALVCRGRQIVGIALVADSPVNDHEMGPPARPTELVFLGIMNEHYDTVVLQRLFDYVLGPLLPAQTWINRANQRLRRFLRVNGFTLDGLSVIDPDTQLPVSRMTR